MFVRNLLQAGAIVSLNPGEYAVPVPVGIPLTLQYSDKGLLQKVFLNHDKSEWVDRTSEYYQIIFKRNQAPCKISLTGNTSYVRGVLVTDKIYTAHTADPDSILSEICKSYLEDPESFTFYAGDVESTVMTFSGALATRQWLTVSRFKTLPGYVVPRDVTEEQFLHMLKLNCPFVFPLIASYIVFHNDGQATYPHVQLQQVKVAQLNKVLDHSGYILIEVVDNLAVTRTVPYAKAVALDLRVGSIIVVDAANQIIHCLAAGDEYDKNKLPTKFRCDCCGRQIIVPATGSVSCSDPQCNSVLYPRVKQLCHELHLPELTYESYWKFATEVGNVFTVLDIFEHPDYKDLHVDITVAQGLRSIIPRTILPGQTQINELCDAFSNSVQTLTYYVQNPDKLKTDFDLDSHIYNRWLTWIQNVENCSDVVELFKLPNVSVVTSTKTFEGDPIFRGKLIYITGVFMHGSVEEVAKILRSYSADVTPEFSEDVDCVIIGDNRENLNGHAIIEARKHRIPIMTESEFFTTYEIDEDLAENL